MNAEEAADRLRITHRLPSFENAVSTLARGLVGPDNEVAFYVNANGRIVGANGAELDADAIEVNLTKFNAAGDARTVSDGAMTGSSKVLTSATASFTSSDIGKYAIVSDARGNLGSPAAKSNPLVAKIVSVQSSSQVTLATAALFTVSARTVHIGTDNAPMIQDAIDELNEAGGGTIVVPNGNYLLVVQEDLVIEVAYPTQKASVEMKSNVSIRGDTGAIFLFPWQGQYDGDTDRGFAFVNNPGAENMEIRGITFDGGDSANGPINERPHTFWVPNLATNIRLVECTFVGGRGKAILGNNSSQVLMVDNRMSDAPGNFCDFYGGSSDIKCFRNTVENNLNVDNGGGAEAFIFTSIERLSVQDCTVTNWGTGVSLVFGCTDVNIARLTVRAPANDATGGYGIGFNSDMLGKKVSNLVIESCDIDVSDSTANFNGISNSAPATLDRVKILNNRVKTNSGHSSNAIGLTSATAASVGVIATGNITENGGILIGTGLNGAAVYGNVGTIAVSASNVALMSNVVQLPNTMTVYGNDCLISGNQCLAAVTGGDYVMGVLGNRNMLVGNMMTAEAPANCYSLLRIGGTGNMVDVNSIRTCDGVFCGFEAGATGTTYGVGNVLSTSGASSAYVVIAGRGAGSTSRGNIFSPNNTRYVIEVSNAGTLSATAA